MVSYTCLLEATGVISGMPQVFLVELYKPNQAKTNHSELLASGFLSMTASKSLLDTVTCTGVDCILCFYHIDTFGMVN